MDTPNKDLEGIDHAEVLQKIARDQALTRAEAAIGFGLPYSTVKALTKEKGFPLIGDRFFPSDFKLWRRQKTGLLSAHGNEPRPQPRAAGKSYVSPLKHG